MRSRSKNNSLLPGDPWVLSTALHAVLVGAVFSLMLLSRHRTMTSVDITIYEQPRQAQQAIEMTQPKKQEQVKPRGHEVFGISPKAIASDEGEAVKAGNTVAKAPDREVLKPGDAESLPVPSEDYLVTRMPELRSEVRVPYPAGPRKKGIQGAVVMDLLIDVTGKVRDVTLIEGPDPELNAAAVTAAKGFQFSAAQIQDKPVAVRIRYTYRFVLER